MDGSGLGIAFCLLRAHVQANGLWLTAVGAVVLEVGGGRGEHSLYSGCTILTVFPVHNGKACSKLQQCCAMVSET